eukprot:CAMPEP_0198691634 /NCGR_PEP_ID=MMETSP1468-20131203/208872_1 /TAXON_ID=1461545 /ORGANISM="Mantoniella sp, Strain CCMP1436" /LENGTH=87 /DNA_ID=CAMNT_0044445001 /DNA_START=67 /DNA_END=327 /DNA_ORIENTATION=-
MAPDNFSRCDSTAWRDRLSALPGSELSRFTTSFTACEPNTCSSVFSMPPLRVAYELEHDPHAPVIRTATMPSSIPTTSTLPPSAMRN